MPYKPPTHKTATSGAPRHSPDGNRSSRYDRRWEKLRIQMLRRSPMCSDCQRNPANEVHHIQKAKDRPDLMYTESNLMTLCRSCHSKRTRRGE
jgi:5-methylcytosine-specific restriction protein A